MRTRDIKSANLTGYAHDSNGYLKKCKYCGITIYMHKDYDGITRPYESWVAGNVEEGEWVIHDCMGTNYHKNVMSNCKATNRNNKERVCPKCHIVLPLASNKCDNCGYEIDD